VAIAGADKSSVRGAAMKKPMTRETLHDTDIAETPEFFKRMT
jgi:hypothetical protein